MKVACITLLALCALSAIECFTNPTLNKIIDAIITSQVNKGNDFDPLAVEDKGFEFERKVGFVTLTGIAKFRNITLKGLNSLKRTEDVQTQVLSEASNRMIVDVEMFNLVSHMEGVLKVGGLGFQRTFSGKIDNVHAQAILVYNRATDRMQLTKFAVKDMSGVVLKVEGSFEVVDSLTNFVVRVAVNNFNRYFRYAIEFAMTKVFESRVATSDALRKAMMVIQ